MEKLQAKIFGHVQGVFYRAHTKKKAQELGLSGFVRNEPDGTVYLEVEGNKENLEKLLKWCYEGSPRARVDKINYQFSKATEEFQGFKIRY